MLNQEIRFMLNDMEAELFEFVKFITDVEEQQGHTAWESSNAVPSVESNALFDAFNIIKNMLFRTFNLIEQFSSSSASSDNNSLNSHLVNHYYIQYVYHIVFFLTKMIEENWSKFSEKVNHLASSQERKEQHSSKKWEPPKYPTSKYFKPTTSLRRHECPHKRPQSRNYKSGLKSTGHSKERDLDSSASDEDHITNLDKKTGKHYSSKYGIRGTSGSTLKILHKITDSLIAVTNVMETVLLLVQNLIKKQNIEKQEHSSHSENKNLPDKLCCTSSCALCCVLCRDSYQKPQHKDSSETSETDEESPTAYGMKHKGIQTGSAGKHGGFSFLPEKLEDVKKGLKDTLMRRNENGGYSYPNLITFNVPKFSELLQDDFKEHASKIKEISDATKRQNTIIDKLVDCFTECCEFDYASDKRVDKTGLYDEIDSDSTEETDVGRKSEKCESVDSFMSNVMNVAKTIVKTAKDEKTFTTEEEQVLEELKDVDFFTTGSTSSEQRLGVLVPRMKTKKRKFALACAMCSKDVEDKISSKEKDSLHGLGTQIYKKARKSLKGTCFECWNECHRGLTIHQCHDILPAGILEIRHMDTNGKICVCFCIWNRAKEPDDWRWQKNLFNDPTRVEVVQQAAFDKDPVLKVIYGPKETMVKESLAETQLKTVRALTKEPPLVSKCPGFFGQKGKSVSESWMNACSNKIHVPAAFQRHNEKSEKAEPSPEEHNIVRKLSRFFEDIHSVGYGKGPPLVIKIRRKSVLHDTYDILMAPSRIRLSYYRNLRVLFLPDDETQSITTSTNFINEDRSDELFEIFARKLFSNGEMHLFEYPSEETQSLYFNPETHSHPQWFTFAGTVLALAILHKKQMYIKLAYCLYKTLLDRPLSVDDLQDLDPLFYQKLMWMKKNDISTNKRKITFTIRDKIGNRTYENELMANGNNITVTERNKFRYIELAAKWKLAERCLSPLKDFRNGFAAVIDPAFLSLFSEKELQGLIRRPPEDEMFISKSSSVKATNQPTRRGTW